MKVMIPISMFKQIVASFLGFQSLKQKFCKFLSNTLDWKSVDVYFPKIVTTEILKYSGYIKKN